MGKTVSFRDGVLSAEPAQQNLLKGMQGTIMKAEMIQCGESNSTERAVVEVRLCLKGC